MGKLGRDDFQPKDLSKAASGRPSYPVAGFWVRAAAFVMDVILLNFFAYLLIFMFKEQLFKLGYYCGFLGVFINLAYFTFFNGPYGKGKTPGKIFLNITTLQWSGEPLTMQQAATRTVIQLNFLVLLHLLVPLFIRDIETIRQLFTIQILRNLAFAFFVANAVLVATNPFKCGLHDSAVRSYVARDPKRLDIPAVMREEGERIERWQRSSFQSAGIAFIVVFVIFIFNVSRSLLSEDAKRQFEIRNDIKARLQLEGFEFVGPRLSPEPGAEGAGDKSQPTPAPTMADAASTTETAAALSSGYVEFMYLRYGKIDAEQMQRNRDVERALRRAKWWVAEEFPKLLEEISQSFEAKGVTLSFREVINLNTYFYAYDKVAYETSEKIE
jgi:uncharacterized RDD family membrane protein YckC